MLTHLLKEKDCKKMMVWEERSEIVGEWRAAWMVER